MTNELASVKMSYEVNGEPVNLTMNTVKNYLVRGQADKITDQEIVMFMNLCKYQKLNPFLNEAYLVKFGNDAQIITGKEAFMKRAESHEQYEGFEAGIFVTDREGNLNRREGTFKLPDENLVGGWAKVYRNDRKVPVIAEVSMQEYSKNQSTWKQIPSTMIRKVALVQALREAFPADLGALYTAEEVQDTPVAPRNVEAEVYDEIKENANKEVIDFEETEPVYRNQRGEVITKNDEVPMSYEEVQQENNNQGALFNNLNEVTDDTLNNLDPGY